VCASEEDGPSKEASLPAIEELARGLLSERKRAPKAGDEVKRRKRAVQRLLANEQGVDSVEEEP
jgi:hypothetical protein